VAGQSEKDVRLAQKLGQLQPFLAVQCIPTGMHGPTCIFWANLTHFSLKRGNFHALFHKFTDEHPGCGGHAFSRDGEAWTLHGDSAYTTDVTTTLGTAHKFYRRERPHLLFDAGLLIQGVLGVPQGPSAPRGEPS
jgi:hypothetical protein